jgi:NAD(P)-dependent dehydrogenase (short-subunit alcohol dehydrogenase family)
MALESLKDPGIRDAALATTPLKKIARPEDITGTIAFLASSKLSGHISGEIITMYFETPFILLYLIAELEEWKAVN